MTGSYARIKYVQRRGTERSGLTSPHLAGENTGDRLPTADLSVPLLTHIWSPTGDGSDYSSALYWASSRNGGNLRLLPLFCVGKSTLVPLGAVAILGKESAGLGALELITVTTFAPAFTAGAELIYAFTPIYVKSIFQGSGPKARDNPLLVQAPDLPVERSQEAEWVTVLHRYDHPNVIHKF